MARPALLAVLFLVCSVHAIPEETASAMEDLLEFVQEEKSKEKAAGYSTEEFAELMNSIIARASKMRVVMNKLGISDTDSVKSIESHFIELAAAHKADLGEGEAAGEEELRLRGLQARSCLKHATSCSRQAATCPDEVTQCKEVVDGCTRAAAVCGVNDLTMMHKKKDTKKAEEHKSLGESDEKESDKKAAEEPAKAPVREEEEHADEESGPGALEEAQPEEALGESDEEQEQDGQHATVEADDESQSEDASQTDEQSAQEQEATTGESDSEQEEETITQTDVASPAEEPQEGQQEAEEHGSEETSLDSAESIEAVKAKILADTAAAPKKSSLVEELEQLLDM